MEEVRITTESGSRYTFTADGTQLLARNGAEPVVGAPAGYADGPCRVAQCGPWPPVVGQGLSFFVEGAGAPVDTTPVVEVAP